MCSIHVGITRKYLLWSRGCGLKLAWKLEWYVDYFFSHLYTTYVAALRLMFPVKAALFYAEEGGAKNRVIGGDICTDSDNN